MTRDWAQIEEQRADLRRLLDESAHRIGIEELAHALREDASTLVHQLRHHGMKRPSADLLDMCALLDPVYRERRAAVTGEVLSRPPDLTPEQFARGAIDGQGHEPVQFKEARVRVLIKYDGLVVELHGEPPKEHEATPTEDGQEICYCPTTCDGQCEFHVKRGTVCRRSWKVAGASAPMAAVP